MSSFIQQVFVKHSDSPFLWVCELLETDATPPPQPDTAQPVNNCPLSEDTEAPSSVSPVLMCIV